MMRADAELFADGDELDVSLWLFGRNSRRCGVEDGQFHLRASALAAIQIDQNLAALVVDVSDIAVRSIEDQLFLLELIALLADDRSSGFRAGV